MSLFFLSLVFQIWECGFSNSKIFHIFAVLLPLVLDPRPRDTALSYPRPIMLIAFYSTMCVGPVRNREMKTGRRSNPPGRQISDDSHFKKEA
jgi:hypothetical protein